MRLHIEENICNCIAISAATHEIFFLTLCNCILGRPFDLNLCKCATPSEKYKKYCIAKHIIAMRLHIEKNICNCKAKDADTHETFFITLRNSISGRPFDLKLCNCIAPSKEYKSFCIAKHNIAMRLHIEKKICNCIVIGAVTHETLYTHSTKWRTKYRIIIPRARDHLRVRAIAFWNAKITLYNLQEKIMS